MLFFRFASSAFLVFESIYKSYKTLILTYEQYRQSVNDDDEIVYKVRGWDYALTLVFFLDILKPIKYLMIEVQDVSTQIWTSIDAVQGALNCCFIYVFTFYIDYDSKKMNIEHYLR